MRRLRQFRLSSILQSESWGEFVRRNLKRERDRTDEIDRWIKTPTIEPLPIDGTEIRSLDIDEEDRRHYEETVEERRRLRKTPAAPDIDEVRQTVGEDPTR
jgi:hypothetical protein